MRCPHFSAPIILTAASCLAILECEAADKTRKIIVASGDIDRARSIVSFNLPEKPGAGFQLTDSDGRPVPFQTDETHRAQFIAVNLKKGTEQVYWLKSGTATTAPGSRVEVTREKDRVQVTIGGKEVLGYQAGAGELPRADIKPIFRRGGYIHPVVSPSGRVVTDDYPPNHLHHHGIWFPWTKTEFEGRQPDFWNMGEGKGTVEFVGLDQTWSGPVSGGFRVRHRFVDLTGPQPKVALIETWTVTIYNVGNRYRMFDLVSTQECATAAPLRLPKYHYGGLGFRGNWSWNGKDNTFFLTSEGESDRVKGNETRGRWCHVSGKVNGELTGIAILCHPSNFRAPQPMRLHPGEPFFCFAPSQLGDWEITPGKQYVSRYRFVVADGPADKAELDGMWNDYANPAVVSVKDP